MQELSCYTLLKNKNHYAYKKKIVKVVPFIFSKGCPQQIAITNDLSKPVRKKLLISNVKYKVYKAGFSNHFLGPMPSAYNFLGGLIHSS